MVAVKVAAAVAVLAAGGTAVAAETGNLPAGAQRFLTGLGGPAPSGGPRPTATGAGRTAPGTRSAPAVTPGPPRKGATSGPAEFVALDLCRTWHAARTNPDGKAVPAETRQALADLAGGEKRIDGFCADVLGASPSATVSPSASTTVNPSASASGKDKPGKSATPHPTPTPKDSNGKRKG